MPVRSDSKKIVFASDRGGDEDIYTMNADGSGAVNLAPAKGFDGTPEWSHDGKWIVFTQQRRGGFDICVVPSSGGSATTLVDGEDPSWGPNSRTVVYAVRDGKGNRRLSMLDVPTKQTKTVSRISGSNSQPSWAK